MMRLAIVALLLAAGACRNRLAPAAQTTSEYTDLVPGGRISVVVPLLRGDGFLPHGEIAKESSNIITTRATDLIGFQISHYAIEGADGRVSLRFLAAETSREGQVSGQGKALKLPVALPPKRQHVRLIYFVRSSRADHNMAIAASQKIEDLTEFTRQLRLDPSVCGVRGSVFCVWVPGGVAVRPE